MVHRALGTFDMMGLACQLVVQITYECERLTAGAESETLELIIKQKEWASEIIIHVG